MDPTPGAGQTRPGSEARRRSRHTTATPPGVLDRGVVCPDADVATRHITVPLPTDSFLTDQYPPVVQTLHGYP